MSLWLMHYGIKGQKWGVRRFQNKDGSLTTEGRDRYMYGRRARRAMQTKDDMDRLYNTLSDADKRLLGDDDAKKEWLSAEEGEYVVKRFIEKYGDTPIAALDIMTTTRDGHLTVAIMTDPNYRGSGYAQKLAKKGRDWVIKNADKYGVESLGWGAYASNKGSTHIAEKTGFKYNKRSSSDDWSVYDYRVKKRRIKHEQQNV